MKIWVSQTLSTCGRSRVQIPAEPFSQIFWFLFTQEYRLSEYPLESKKVERQPFNSTKPWWLEIMFRSFWLKLRVQRTICKSISRVTPLLCFIMARAWVPNNKSTKTSYIRDFRASQCSRWLALYTRMVPNIIMVQHLQYSLWEATRHGHAAVLSPLESRLQDQRRCHKEYAERPVRRCFPSTAVSQTEHQLQCLWWRAIIMVSRLNKRNQSQLFGLWFSPISPYSWKPGLGLLSSRARRRPKHQIHTGCIALDFPQRTANGTTLTGFYNTC